MLIASLVASSLLSAAPASCEDLARLSIPHSAITQAQVVAAGAFVQNAQDDRDTYKSLPAFCRVAATLTPTNDSDIKIEVWLPAAGWNGKFMAVGNGAFSGAIAYPAMAAALKRGYAVSSTDTGHTGNNARFGLGHPEKVNDFAWRAVHEMTVASKRVVDAFYSAPPKFSYWNGCSAGGRQGMKEAQRFPEDFDGIIAGAPGMDWTGRASQAVRVASTLAKNPSARLLAPQRQLLHSAVLAACDATDGVTDGVIAIPPQCKFDPAVLQCKADATSGCLTSAQVATAKLMYESTLQPGSELGWTDEGWTASARATGVDQFRFLVFGDPAWDLQRFDFEKDSAAARSKDRNSIDALDSNLKPFFARGGKLIQYHGWGDPQISPENTTRYFAEVSDVMGDLRGVFNSYRLFMVPGMGHCGGGEGPNTFDMVTALEQWVEHDAAPAQIVASRVVAGAVARTGLLCPYPQAAVYGGTGSGDDAASFRCSSDVQQPADLFSYRPDQISIKLQRTVCFGSCPIYSITVLGDGTVKYFGSQYVGVEGAREAKIPGDQVEKLVNAFLAAWIFDARDEYGEGEGVEFRPDGRFGRYGRGGVIDAPSQILTIELGARKKRVVLNSGYPAELGKLPALIDEITQSKQWTAVTKD